MTKHGKKKYVARTLIAAAAAVTLIGGVARADIPITGKGKTHKSKKDNKKENNKRPLLGRYVVPSNGSRPLLGRYIVPSSKK
jgi:hypothetical protein